MGPADPQLFPPTTAKMFWTPGIKRFERLHVWKILATTILQRGGSAQPTPSKQQARCGADSAPRLACLGGGSVGRKSVVGRGPPSPPRARFAPHTSHCSWGLPAAKFVEVMCKSNSEGRTHMLLQPAGDKRQPQHIVGRKVGCDSTAQPNWHARGLAQNTSLVLCG